MAPSSDCPAAPRGDAARAAEPPPGSAGVFAGGPPLKLQFRLGLLTPEELHVARRTLLFVALGWLPLLLLCAIEGSALGARGRAAFLTDFAVHARHLVAVPLLLAAEATTIRVLSTIALRFVELLPGEGDRQRYLDELAALRRLRDSPLAEIAVFALALALALATIHGLGAAGLPAWQRTGGAPPALSWAGWWYALVSLPLVLMLLCGLLWRLFLWTRLLVIASHLPLQLVAVHPDKAAGLAFVGYSLRAFCLAGAAIGAIVAGTMANDVLHHGASIASYKYTIAWVAAAVVVMFTAPLFSFSALLIAVWRSGVRKYDELASLFGRRFEREWFDGLTPKRHDDLLERGDFSAGTDLFQVVDRVHDLRIVPVDLMSVAMLAAATLVPFVPVILAAVPFDAVFAALVGLVR